MDLFSVILGWLLGVLSTPLVMYLTATVERRRFKNVLQEELRETRFRLTALIFSLRNHLGTIDRSTLQWIVSELESYPQRPERDKLLEGTQRLNELTDAQLTALATRPRDPLGTKAVSKVVTPYLSAKLDSIGLLCADKQKDLVNLLHYVEVINLKATEMADWDRRTFEVTNDDNHALAAGNSESSMKAIITAAERAAACIKNYLS